MVSLNSPLNSVTKKDLKTERKIAGLESRISCVRDKETETLPLSHRATDNRTDPYTEPNSCLSDFSDSLNFLNSLNSMNVLLHLEKTPFFLFQNSSCRLNRIESLEAIEKDEKL